MTLSVYNLVKNILNILMGIAAFFLVLRIIFLFFSVNPATPFVSWILSIGGSLSSPFAGIAPAISVPAGVLDVVSVIALVVYLVVEYLLLAILRGIAEPQMLREYDTTTRTYHDIDRDREVEEEEEYPARRRRRVRRVRRME